MSSAALLVVAACASGPSREVGKSRPATASAKPNASGWNGTVKVGNPYQVAGVWYYPKDDRDYDETGIASWYGPGFHGKATANGEVYDMDGVSAAHKTLPLPSYVEVTNLETGRSLVVRVNDRGPFVGDRIIDLSRRTAQLLGLDRAGTGRVRVKRVFPKDAPETLYASRTQPKSVPAVAAPAPVAPPVAVASAVPSAAAGEVIKTVAVPSGGDAKLTPAIAAAPAAPGAAYIQVAALSDEGRAAWLAGYFKSFATSSVERTSTGLFRVRLGPFPSRDAAQGVLVQVHSAGYGEARVVGALPSS